MPILELISQYPQFNDFRTPQYLKWGESDYRAYHDEFIKLVSPGKNIALITEPRTIWGMYGFNLGEFLKLNYKKFDFIFSFDDEILTLPNAYPMPFVGVWDRNDLPKTKLISFCCSDKRMCEGHLRRRKLAGRLKGRVDMKGNYLSSKATTKEIYGDYMFSVVLENEISEYYYTEKVLNAFANKTIPIYYGSPLIPEIFDPDGIIVADYNEIENIVSHLRPEDYYSRIDAVNKNFELSKNYECYEDYLYLTYKDLFDRWLR